VDGLVSYIGEGRIVIQESPEDIELEAGLDGVVVESRLGRGVVIETFGTVVQGVWGNGRRALGPLRMEPDEGLESILGEEIDIQYRGAIVVTRRRLRETGLITLDAQNLAGVIAPSMDADLIPAALDAHAPVLLTEGFGPVRMSAVVFNMLNSFEGRQAALDAVQPSRWETRRPEVILNPTARAQTRPPRPNVNLALGPGVTVRLTRPPNAGATGKVTHLPKSPILLENGLRVPCALVETVAGERLTVPLANIEVLGR
jgi:hypothetical protein